MTRNDSSPENMAVVWTIKVDAPDFEDWPELEAWLGKSPENAVLFDLACRRLAQAEDVIALRDPAEHLRLVTPSEDRLSPSPTRLDRLQSRWRPIGLAASIAAVLAIGYGIFERPASEGMQHIATRPGELRTIEMSDDSRVLLNGDTRMAIAPRRVEMSRGQASFTVMHDSANPFSVTVKGAVIRDLGTRFDVHVAEKGTEVAVAEGLVQIEAAGATVLVKAAERTFIPSGRPPEAPEPLDPGTVSGWQTGLLTFEDSSYSEVIAAVKRRTGLAIMLAPELEDRRFAGALTVNGSPETVMQRLAATLDLHVRHRSDGWILERSSRRSGR